MKLIAGTYEHTITEKGKPYVITHGTYEISPEDAQRLLDTNKNNRRPHATSIAKMERSHLDGNWKYLGDTIQIDNRGVLMNGQHRLKAAINAGRSLVIPVAKGFPTSYFYFMDISKPRTTNDAFGIYGIKNGRNASKVVTMLWQMSSGNYPSGNRGGQSPSPPEAIDLFFKFGDEDTNQLESHIIRGANATATRLNIGAVGALSYLYSLVDPEMNELFWEGVIDGLNIQSSSDPRKALTNFVGRQWDLTEGSGLGLFRPGQCGRWIHFAWKKWIEGKEIRARGFQAGQVEAELEREMTRMAAAAIAR